MIGRERLLASTTGVDDVAYLLELFHALELIRLGLYKLHLCL